MFFQHAVARRVLGINLCGCGKAVAGLWLWQIRIKKYVAVAVADLIDDEIDPCFRAKEARMMKLILVCGAKEALLMKLIPFFVEQRSAPSHRVAAASKDI